MGSYNTTCELLSFQKRSLLVPYVELEVEFIFAVTGFAGEKIADSSNKIINKNLVLSDRVRLSLVSSFIGRDKFEWLQAKNTPVLEDVTRNQMSLRIQNNGSNNTIYVGTIRTNFT